MFDGLVPAERMPPGIWVEYYNYLTWKKNSLTVIDAVEYPLALNLGGWFVTRRRNFRAVQCNYQRFTHRF